MKLLYSLSLMLTLMLFATVASAQPANDNCAGIVVFPNLNSCLNADNVDATATLISNVPVEQIPTCWSTVNNDVWFQFTTTASVVDVVISVEGVNTNGDPLQMPQIAVYRGTCMFGDLAFLDCAQAAINTNDIELLLQGLDPNENYFIRVDNYSATGNTQTGEGDFEICIAPYVPPTNFCSPTANYTVTSSSGTLFDSGGATGNYGNGENCSVTICPTSFFSCLEINIPNYALENDFDFLRFFDGTTTTAPQLGQLTGPGTNFVLQTDGCITIQFTSDGSVVQSGFAINWSTSSSACTLVPISCADAVSIPSLPYNATGLTTCGAGNTFSAAAVPCTGDAFLNGEEYIFEYVSTGDECISVELLGENTGTGITVTNGCGVASTACVATSTTGFIETAYLPTAGTYYITVARAAACTPFDIVVESVECPTVFPSAAACSNALSLNGCESGTASIPSNISLLPGQGDPAFFQTGVNNGCWGGVGNNSFTWFIFQAATDGDLAFTFNTSSSTPVFVDIDFLVWGPVANPDNLCNVAYTQQPVRCSYAGGGTNEATGLAAIHPVTGASVTDTYDGQGGPLDDFVSPLPVVQGQWYVILLNDWGGTTEDGVSLDFSGATAGIFGEADDVVALSPLDTAVCPGQPVQMQVTGGELFEWTSAAPATLSCTNCPNPIVTPSETTTYEVLVNTVCGLATVGATVEMVSIKSIDDITVCQGDDVLLEAGTTFQDTSITWSWAPLNSGLSCYDCPAPLATPSVTTEYIVTLSSPFCTLSDTVVINVIPSQAPVYTISNGEEICTGSAVNIGGPATPNLSYTWTPNEFISNTNGPNPSVNPDSTMMYYLEVADVNNGCVSFDSVLVEVFYPPMLSVAGDTQVCQGQSVQLAFTSPNPGDTYAWVGAGLDDDEAANPIASPAATTTYTVTASNGACQETGDVTVSVVTISLDITQPDTILICKGEAVDLNAVTSPNSATLTWTPDNGSLSSTSANDVVATPISTTTYIAMLEVPGCMVSDQIVIQVDSLPNIPVTVNVPGVFFGVEPDTVTICEGQQAFFSSPSINQNLYPFIDYEWLPEAQIFGANTNLNAATNPINQTTTISRVTTNRACTDTFSVVFDIFSPDEVNISASENDICQGTSIQLTGTGASTFNWTATPADPTLSGTSGTSLTATPSQTTTYSAQTVVNGCTVTNSVTVSVSTPPQYNVINNATICLGEDITLGTLNAAGTTYTWSPNVGNTGNPTVSPLATTTYTLTASSGACIETESVTITVIDPVVSISGDNLICAGESTTLTATSGGGGSIVWTNSAGQQVGTGSSLNVSASDTYTATYTLNGCSASDSYAVTVADAVSVEITVQPGTEVEAGTSVTLTANILSGPTSGLQYAWSSSSGANLGTTASVSDTPASDPTAYNVTVTTAEGCTATASTSITVLMPDDVVMPNVFTPNGDGTNDRFAPVFGFGTEIVEFQVFSRWGELVHDNPGTGWDGEYNGSPMPADVYVYYIRIRYSTGEEETLKGDFTLLR